MSFRVYDTEKKQWIKDDIYMNSNEDLFLIKRFFFGLIKSIVRLNTDKYVYHKDIGIVDKDNKTIYEGDYIQATVEKANKENDRDKVEIGVVSFAHELSAYVLLCVNSDIFYTLGSNVSSEIEIIGNVFDGYGITYEG